MADARCLPMQPVIDWLTLTDDGTPQELTILVDVIPSGDGRELLNSERSFLGDWIDYRLTYHWRVIRTTSPLRGELLRPVGKGKRRTYVRTDVHVRSLC